jgi:hypothetical protein
VEIALWPVALRADLVRAFRPGEPSSREGPFRTLRQHNWATPGVPVRLRHGGRAAGRVMLYSMLNVDAAVCARCGDVATAVKLAKAAGRLEHGGSFIRLQKLLADLPPATVSSIAGGTLAEGLADLTAVLRKLALQTEAARHGRPVRPLHSFLIGRISQATGDYVVVTTDENHSFAVPRDLARAANRDRVGDCLGVISSPTDDRGLIVRAVPGIDLGPDEHERYSPFARPKGFERISAADAAYLRGTPTPPRVLVPVSIER